MSKDMKTLRINLFDSNNLKGAKAADKTIFNLALSAICADNVPAIEDSFNSMSEDFEKIMNNLEIDESNGSINTSCYYFGRIAAINDIILKIIEEQQRISISKEVLKSYRLLVPALSIIKEHGTISGSELKKELNLKSSSNLSNFLKRIDKYNLVNVKKIGTVNYISLTHNGMLLLAKENNDKDDTETKITITQLFDILDGVKVENAKENASSLKIIHKNVPSDLPLEDQRLLKQKFNQIFYARNDFLKSSLECLIDEYDLKNKNNKEGNLEAKFSKTKMLLGWDPDNNNKKDTYLPNWDFLNFTYEN